MTPEKLKELMKTHQINNTDLVKDFDVSRQLVWHWKNRNISKAWQIVLKQYFTKIAMERDIKL